MQYIRIHEPDDSRRTLSGRIDAFGWGLFFIWLGVAFLADVGWPLGIAGVGAIALGSQAVRKYEGLPVDRFGLVVGVVMVGWGAWSYFQPHVGPLQVPAAFWPVVFIAVGAVLVVRAVLRRPPPDGADSAQSH